jgi:hypothetical protein
VGVGFFCFGLISLTVRRERFAHGANTPPYRDETAKGWATRLVAGAEGSGDLIFGLGVGDKRTVVRGLHC